MNEKWKEKYWELMIADDIENAVPLQIKNFPDSFFKYRKLSERTIESIRENYIWLAEISSLNDPFECSIQFDNDECLREFYSSETFKNNFVKKTGQILSEKEIKSIIKSKKPYDKYIEVCKTKNVIINLSPERQLEKVQKRWNVIVEETNRNLRICSFSLEKNSLLLWSHYSDEHKGICLEYDFLNAEEFRTFIQPVIYRDKVHKIGLFEEYKLMQMIGSSLIKSGDWSYEKEWRLTIFKQKEKFPQKMKAPSPKAIYLGTRFHLNKEHLKNELFKIAAERKIPLYQMIKHPNEFKLIEKE